MKISITPKNITKDNFSKFGDMITTDGINPIEINEGFAKRFDGIANIDTSNENGETTICIFSALKRSFPMKIDMMEKHPLGSQAFIPMKPTTFLAKKVVGFIGINAWLPKGCFSIMSIFIGNDLLSAEKIHIVVSPFSFDVSILAIPSNLFANPSLISIGLIPSVVIISPNLEKLSLVIFFGVIEIFIKALYHKF